MSGRADILLYVQHLLGIGHVQRAAAIARALGERGASVAFVSGGLPVPDLDTGSARLIQLPPVQSRDETFSALVDDQGQAIDEAWKDNRRAKLLAAFHDARPRLVMTEMFPFGRRQMRFELLPLLEAARRAVPRPAIVCSVRDVLNPQRSPGKTDWIVETVNGAYDRVLVHGDPSVIRLEETFPAVARLRPPVAYTGYVVGPPATAAPPAPEDPGEVLVSVGGGRVAKRLLEAVLAARALGPLAGAPWRLLVGAHFPEPDLAALSRRTPAGVVVERTRPDFQALLARCRLSISQAGYNTVMEVVRAGRPAVVVPFTTPSESEQDLRARVLERRGALAVVDEATLSAASLDQGVRRALARAERPRAGPAIRMDGAETTAEIVTDLLEHA